MAQRVFSALLVCRGLCSSNHLHTFGAHDFLFMPVVACGGPSWSRCPPAYSGSMHMDANVACTLRRLSLTINRPSFST